MPNVHRVVFKNLPVYNSVAVNDALDDGILNNSIFLTVARDDRAQQ